VSITSYLLKKPVIQIEPLRIAPTHIWNLYAGGGAAKATVKGGAVKGAAEQ